MIDFAAVPQTVRQIYLIMTVKNRDFSALRGCYARVTDQTCSELVRFQVPECGENGFIFGRAIHSEKGTWRFQKVGIFADTPNIPSKISEVFLKHNLANFANFKSPKPVPSSIVDQDCEIDFPRACSKMSMTPQEMPLLQRCAASVEVGSPKRKKQVCGFFLQCA